MLNVIIVHGEKPARLGDITQEFLERLEESVKLEERADFDFIIVTGGKTRKNIVSEAELGYNYLKGKVSTPILLEEKARTTSENIRFVRDLLKKREINEAFVITSKKRIFRAKYLYSALWPELYPKTKFVPAKDYYPVLYYFIEFIFLFFSIIDPQEKVFARIPKMIFRNG